ncbi:MAG: hypothetical protein HRT73_13715 [Flavobacteriales bacterium]|nr:hypothetical protein [Flavobacteriales bacterium]
MKKPFLPIYQLASILLIFFILFSCSSKKEVNELIEPEENPSNSCNLASINSNSTIKGFKILEKFSGIWNGPVYSPTPLGSYPEWIVDFRPISGSQISAKNELDSVNDIFMSFFITKHDCSYKIAFRNGGGFAGSVRNAYMVIDSLDETVSKSFYRFIDPVSGGDRIYTDITFKQDSLIMHVYTNKYNSLSSPVTHMIWTANLRDTTSAQDAINLFNFPQKELTKDFSTTFDGLSDAVFYNTSSDPYPEQDQPYLGVSNINISITNPVIVDPSKKVLISITTQPLFSGVTFIPANLDFRSRYVFVNAANPSEYNFNYMHPGDYYVNAIYDSNGDFIFSSGDYISSNFDVPLTLTDQGNSSINVNINLLIP